MDIDKLFKVPRLPGGNKRKLPDNPTPEMLKKLRMDSQSAGESSDSMDVDPPHRTTRRATVEEADDDGQDRSFAPNGDADYFAEEDGEGRFYGGGLTSEQKEILNIFEDAGEDANAELPEMNLAHVRRLLLTFERAVNKNQDQRSKYPNDPTKFIDSEADLDLSIKGLLPLSQIPLIAYPELARSTALSLLVGLLTHENLDIVIDAIELIHELTDEDPDAEEEDEGEDDALKTLVEALVQKSAFELLVDNLSRLNESEEADRQAVFHVLGIFENMIGFNTEYAVLLVSNTKLLPWILKRIQGKKHDENRSYAGELLSILLQNSQANLLALEKENGIESLLTTLSQYRRRDPVDAEEVEFMENLFDSLCSALGEDSLKKQFLETEGLDLMILMMKEKKQSKSRSIKVINHALAGIGTDDLCKAFVDALGLKTLFNAFMSKASKQAKNVTTASEDNTHILGIISSLFTHLESDSPSRIRLLAKFVENDYEKIDKLLELRENARKRLRATDTAIEEKKKELVAEEGDDAITEDMEEFYYTERLDGGLFALQSTDYILAWLAIEDDGVRTHILRLLDRYNQSLEDVTGTLQIFLARADDTQGPDGSPSQREILQGLLSSLSPDSQ